MNAAPEKPIKIEVLSSPAHLPVVRTAVEKLCRMIGFDEDVSGAVVLSVDEALTNIIKHAYHGAEDQPIEIELRPLPAGPAKGLQILIRDYGRQVDPAEIRSRDLKDVRPGGLGVHIMNECMDCVDFEPADGGGTLLTMTKKLSTRQEASK